MREREKGRESNFIEREGQVKLKKDTVCVYVNKIEKDINVDTMFYEEGGKRRQVQ